MPEGTGWTGSSFRARLALPMASVALLLLGQVERKITTWAKFSSHSGKPIVSQARKAASAISRARESAIPTSSEAKITSLLAMKRGSSPACSILASQ